MHPYVYNSIIYTTQDIEAAQGCIDIDEQRRGGILFSHKKEWSLAICSDMDGARV